MTDNILYSVGKRVRTSYLRGEMDESEVMVVYNRYLKDADKVSFNGWAVHELRDELKKTSNPILRQRIQNQIEEHKTKHRVSIDQNKLSLEKLAFFRISAYRQFHPVLLSVPCGRRQRLRRDVAVARIVSRTRCVEWSGFRAGLP